MTTAPSRPLLTREFVTLGVAAGLYFAAFGAINPVMPRFVRGELGGSDAAVGFVLGTFAISAVVLRPLFGRIGDRRNLRSVVAMGGLFGALSMVALLLASSLPLAVVARMLLGASQAALMTGAVTLAVNLAPPERQGEASSYILVAFHLGLSLGPLVGEAILEASSFTAVWWTVGGAMVASSVVALGLPVREPVAVPAGGTPRRLFYAPSVRPGIAMGLGILGFSGFQTFLVLFADQIGMKRAAPVLVVSSVTIVAVRLFGSRVPDRLGPVRGGQLALGLMAGGLFLVAGWQEPAGLYLGTLVGAIGSALLFPSLIPAAVAGVEEHQRGSAMATFTMFIDVGAGVGAPLFGVVASLSSYGGAFVTGGVCCLLTVVYLRVVLTGHLAAKLPQAGVVIDPAVDSA